VLAHAILLPGVANLVPPPCYWFAYFAPGPYPLVLAEAAATTFYTRGAHPLVLADAAAATVYTDVPRADARTAVTAASANTRK